MNHLILKYRNNIDIVKWTAQRLKYYSRSSVQLGAVSQIDYRYGVKKVCKEWADYQLCPSINQLFDLILSDRRAKQSSSVLLVFSWCKYTSSAHRHKYDEFCKSKGMVRVKNKQQ